MAKSKKSKNKKSSLFNRFTQNPKLIALTLVVLGVAILGTIIINNSSAATDCAGSAPCVESSTEVASSSWQLNFSDEFNGTALDTTKWSPQRGGSVPGYGDPYNPSAEDEYYTPNNVTVSGGNLALTLKQQSQSGYPYTSGLIQSGPYYSFPPGSYIESRIKVPSCDGCWPAFWTLDEPVEQHWPPEIDIFEFFNTQSDKRPEFNYHWPANNQSGPKSYGNLSDYTGSYHVYGLYFATNKVVPYVDGVAYPDQGWSSNITQANQYIIFNLATGKGSHPANGSQMLVDWVRVWRPGTGSAPTPVTPTPTPTPTPEPTPTPPSTLSYDLTVAKPTDGQSASGNLTLSGLQSNLKNVEVWYNGANIATAKISSDSWTATVDTTKQSNGDQTYTIYGWDVAAGQQATNTVTKTVTVKVNNTTAAPTPTPVPAPAPAPSYTLTVSKPSANQTLSGKVTFSGTQTNMQNVEIWYGGTVVANATLSNGTWTATVDTTKQANGAQTYNVYAWDVPAGQKAGHTATQDVSVNLSNASPTPTIPATPTPTPNPPVVSGKVKLPTAPAGSKISNIKIDGQTVTGTTYNTRYLTNGNHVLSYTLTDSSGKTTQVSTAFVVNNNLNPFEKVRNSIYSRFHRA